MNGSPASDGSAAFDAVAARELIYASEAKYRRLFETAQDGILILEALSGSIIDVNPFMVELLGYPREEFIGRKLWEIGPFKNIEASKEAFRELQDRHYIRHENLPLEDSEGGRVNVEFVSNLYTVNGKNVIQCNIRDISERKRKEEVDDQHRQSQKMETIGQLAGGIAHDFSNLLGVILGYCQILEERIPLEDSNRRMVEQIQDAGNRAATLTRQLLMFSRRQVLHPVVLDLNRLITGMEAMLRRLIGEHIEITTALLPALGRVRADPAQIEQVLMNLAVNARDAMPEGGTITIETTNVSVNDSDVRQFADLHPGDYVMLAVADNGGGMDGKTLAHIFEPFFTTKQPGRGTGLGLSTVYGIVKQSAGYIYASSGPGEGTVFRIYLPLVWDELEASRREGTSPIHGGRETILVVEDDEPLRQLMRLVLEGFGYAVLESAFPLEAIRSSEQFDRPIALLISDMVMPGVSGRVLAERLTAARPQMKVLFMSGYSADARLDQNSIERGWPLLEKPFRPDALAKRVREILDSPILIPGVTSLS
jgi:PAS domain S-box-containing protein